MSWTDYLESKAPAVVETAMELGISPADLETTIQEVAGRFGLTIGAAIQPPAKLDAIKKGIVSAMTKGIAGKKDVPAEGPTASAGASPAEVMPEGEVMPLSLRPQGELAVVPSYADEKSLAKMTALCDTFAKYAERGVAVIAQRFPDNFVIFPGGGIGLSGRAADLLAASLPLPLKIANVISETSKTPNGYLVYTFMADCENTLTGMVMPIMSEESSEKDFWCKRAGGRVLRPEEVNLRDVRMAAHRGLRKEAIKLFFGVRGLDEKEAKRLGLPTEKFRDTRKGWGGKG